VQKYYIFPNWPNIGRIFSTQYFRKNFAVLKNMRNFAGTKTFSNPSETNYESI